MLAVVEVEEVIDPDPVCKLEDPGVHASEHGALVSQVTSVHVNCHAALILLGAFQQALVFLSIGSCCICVVKVLKELLELLCLDFRCVFG